MDQVLFGCVCRCKIDPLAQDQPVLLKFPENPDMRDKWLQAIKDGSGWNFGTILETSRLCSAHFKEEDLLFSTSPDCLTAKEYAVPCIFDIIPTRSSSSSRIETVTSATADKIDECSSPSSPEVPEPEDLKPVVKTSRRKQNFQTLKTTKKPANKSELGQLEDSKYFLTMKKMAADLDETETSTDGELEAHGSKMEVLDSEHVQTRATDDTSEDEKPLIHFIKSENISPPISPKKRGRGRPSSQLRKLRQRRIIPKIVAKPLSDSDEEATGTVLMVNFDKQGDVNVTETLVKQAQKVGKLERENKQLRTMVDNYQNILKDMGVIVNMKFV